MNRSISTAVFTAIIILTITACGLKPLAPLGDLHITAKLEAPANTDAATMQQTVQSINKRLDAHGIRTSDIKATISGNTISYDIQHADNELVIQRILSSQAQLELRPVVGTPNDALVFEKLIAKITKLQTLRNHRQTLEDTSELVEEAITESDELLFDEETEAESEAPTQSQRILIINNLYENISNAKARISDTALVNEAIGKLRIAGKTTHPYQFSWSLQPDAEQFLTLYLLEPSPLLTGEFVESSKSAVDPYTGGVLVSFQMNKEATEIWASYTRKASTTRTRVAIILDDRVYTAPTVASPIMNGACQVTGDFTENEAKDLANILTAPLPCPIHIVQFSYSVE